MLELFNIWKCHPLHDLTSAFSKSNRSLWECHNSDIKRRWQPCFPLLRLFLASQYLPPRIHVEAWGICTRGEGTKGIKHRCKVSTSQNLALDADCHQPIGLLSSVDNWPMHQQQQLVTKAKDTYSRKYNEQQSVFTYHGVLDMPSNSGQFLQIEPHLHFLFLYFHSCIFRFLSASE